MEPNEPGTLKVLERCRVAPPPNSVPRTPLRLTFFDAIWLQLPPVRLLFFYRLSDDPASASVSTLLSNLKQSLSLALRIFFPLAGNLVKSPESDHYDHELLYTEGDAVQLAVAESDLDFNHLVGSHPRDVTDFHALVPHLTPTDSSPSPVLALQVTIFPNSGLSIGFTLHHAAADGRSTAHFLKSWSHICRTEDASAVDPLPAYDRTRMSCPDGFAKNLVREINQKLPELSDHKVETANVTTRPRVVRATFNLSRTQIERLRNWVNTRRVKSDESSSDFRFSSFTLTCAYVWVCLVRARMPIDYEKLAHFLFAVDGQGRLFPPLPIAYFGNCIGGCSVQVKVGELTQKEGLVVAAESIQSVIGGLEGDGFLRETERSLRKAVELVVMSEQMLLVVGSPRLRLYDTDFGWGKPVKVEVLSREGTNAMSLEGCRDEEGAVEIGLALSESEMNSFDMQFKEGLKSLKMQCSL